MTTRVFFDTNILLYAMPLPVGSAMDKRTSRAEELLGGGGAVSVQVLNEFADVAARKFRQDWTTIAHLLGIVESICGPALWLTADTQRLAVRLAARHGFRIYDAQILASALEAGCEVLYTEDLHHGQVIEGLRIENPFLGL